MSDLLLTMACRFYQHFFSIFFFAPLSNSLMDHATLWSASEPYLFSLTWMWFNVLGNLITQVTGFVVAFLVLIFVAVHLHSGGEMCLLRCARAFLTSAKGVSAHVDVGSRKLLVLPRFCQLSLLSGNDDDGADGTQVCESDCFDCAVQQPVVGRPLDWHIARVWRRVHLRSRFAL
jgi:hypothetical protein